MRCLIFLDKPSKYHDSVKLLLTPRKEVQKLKMSKKIHHRKNKTNRAEKWVVLMTGETPKQSGRNLQKQTSRKLQHNLLLDIYNKCSVIQKKTQVLKIIVMLLNKKITQTQGMTTLRRNAASLSGPSWHEGLLLLKCSTLPSVFPSKGSHRWFCSREPCR